VQDLLSFVPLDSRVSANVTLTNKSSDIPLRVAILPKSLASAVERGGRRRKLRKRELRGREVVGRVHARSRESIDMRFAGTH